MTAALYLSIWLGLVALLAGEIGRSRNRQTLATTGWATLCSIGGVLLTGLHTLLALGVAYAGITSAP